MKCMDLIREMKRMLKKSPSSTKSKGTSKDKRRRKMVGGDNFAKDLERAGKGLGLAMGHTFDSMSNLGKDLYCETNAVMNIGKELDLGYSDDCPYTKTKSWEWSKIKQ